MISETPGIRILGVGKALPQRIVTNEDIATPLGIDPARIYERTGIRERRFAASDESSATLAVAAAKRALAASALTPMDCDLVIAATWTPDYPSPPTATLVQGALGAHLAGTFDVNAACSSFVYAFSAAAAFAYAFQKRVLLIGVDIASRFLNLDDPVTAPLFGDGAGAVIIAHDDELGPANFSLGADGTAVRHALVPAGGSRMPASYHSVSRDLHYVQMTGGKQVMRAAVEQLTAMGMALRIKDADVVVAHQANYRILEELASRLDLDEDKVLLTMDRYANTSSAALPIALCEAWENQRLAVGMRVALLGFGAGFTWGGAVVPWAVEPPAIYSKSAAVLPTLASRDKQTLNGHRATRDEEVRI